jgi:hypothetical protein
MAPASGVPASAIMPATGLPGVPPMPTANTFSAFPTPGFPATNMEVGASGSVVSLSNQAASSRKRILFIAGAAALAVVAGFLLVLVLAGGKAKKAAPSKGSAALLDTGSAHTGSADRAVVAPLDAAASDDDGSGNVEQGSGVGSQEVAITPPTGGSDTAPPPKTDGTCHVDVSSVPTGADVYLAKTKVGTTPGTFDAPCGAPASFNLKKPKFLATERSITPSAAKANKLVVRLGKPMFSIKVTSTPSGATITIGGKSAGVTPTTVKLPSYETSTIALSKPGYASDTQRVTAKTNGQTVHVALKKGGRR